jgi:hypothetical protein
MKHFIEFVWDIVPRSLSKRYTDILKIDEEIISKGKSDLLRFKISSSSSKLCRFRSLNNYLKFLEEV